MIEFDCDGFSTAGRMIRTPRQPPMRKQKETIPKCTRSQIFSVFGLGGWNFFFDICGSSTKEDASNEFNRKLDLETQRTRGVCPSTVDDRTVTWSDGSFAAQQPIKQMPLQIQRTTYRQLYMHK